MTYKETMDKLFMVMVDNLDEAWQSVEVWRMDNDLKPSDIEYQINRDFGIGEFYRDWWEESGEEWY